MSWAEGALHAPELRSQLIPRTTPCAISNRDTPSGLPIHLSVVPPFSPHESETWLVQLAPTWAVEAAAADAGPECGSRRR